MNTRLFRSPTTWLLLVLLAAEFLLFDQFGSRRVTGIHPRWNDQIQYLSEAYTGFEYAKSHGLGAGIWHALTNPSAQGTLHDAAALMVFKLAGASRSAALALNMLALMAWQVALFVVLARRESGTGGRNANLWIAFGAACLPLALNGPWENIPGSAYDFRLDHLAMCAMGVASAAAILMDGGRSRSGAIVFGAAVGITLLARFLTGTYFTLIFLGYAVWAVLGQERARRLANLCVAALTASVIAGPFFWINREWVWNYYYVGHYIGPESAIRNQNFGLVPSLSFVFGGLFDRHLGIFILGLMAFTAIALLIVRFTTRSEPEKADADASTGAAAPALLFPSVLFLLGPAVVLTLHPQKSDVVLSVMAPGVVLLAAAVWLYCLGTRDTGMARTRWTAVAAIGAVVASAAFFAQRQMRTIESPESVADARQVSRLARYILTKGREAQLQPIRVSVDHITDALDAQVLRVICYERHHVWQDFDMKLPTGIAAPDGQVVRQRVSESDFVFLTADRREGRYPYDRSVAELQSELRAWCDSNLQMVESFTLAQRPVVLYQRRELPFAAAK